MIRLLYIFAFLLLTSFYDGAPAAENEPQTSAESGRDTLAFRRTHHFSNNYNFLVRADSIVLLGVQPEEKVSDFPLDTFAIYRKERIVVADIRIIPTDSVDSVWVEVADGTPRFGWLHEGELLRDVVPDDPVSQFIDVFSSLHRPLFGIFLLIVAAVYAVIILRKKAVYLVHWRDIPSFYPSLWCLMVALTRVSYVSIRMSEPELWREFYFHPTLNPFVTPPVLSLFLAGVWMVIIAGIAMTEAVFRELPIGKALLYLAGTAAVAIAAYFLFGITTRYYIGYAFLLFYLVFALYRYFRYAYRPFECGKCGAKMRRKGRCPRCGTINE